MMSQALHAVQARIASEKEAGIDFNELKQAARSNDEAVKFKLGSLTFELINVEDAEDEELLLQFKSQNKGVVWSMNIDYSGQDLHLTSVSCWTSIANLHERTKTILLKANEATAQRIIATFTALDKEIRSRGVLDFAKMSFKLGRYTMLLKKGRSSPSYISKEEFDGNPYVILDFNGARKIEQFSVVEKFDGNGRGAASYNELNDARDDLGRDWYQLFVKRQFSSPLQVAQLVEQNQRLLELINNPDAGSPIEERGILLNVQQSHALFNRHKRGNEVLDRDSFDDGSDAFLMFPNKEKLQSALDAIKVAVTTNGGRIVTERNGALRL